MATLGNSTARPAPAGTPSTGGGQRVAGALLIASVVCMGLMAGLFWGFDISVMPGLGDSDDRTFVTAMQHINADIENGLFGLVFVAALLLPAAAVVVLFAQRRRGAALWTALATVAYFLVLVLTMGVEVPLNDTLARAGSPDRIPDLHKVRTDFEGVWVTVNHFRTLLCTIAVAGLGRALSLHARAQHQPLTQPLAQPYAQPRPQPYSGPR
ncbi:DUF1772 domain-containing protein [Dactylosporangium sp. NPDC048998]|uniref:anthrone oxygenase family protein n=1 Tax=Dactylosporangium sp. NPDC048998 TaxID=3363976 RepID=UPI00371606B1